MTISRRTMLAATCAGLLPRLSETPARGQDKATKACLGVVIHSFPVRASGEKGPDKKAKIADALTLLEHAKGLGLSAIQVDIGARDDAYTDRLRAACEASSIALEGIASLPKDESDVARFEAELRAAKRAGAAIVRTVMFTGRRYETFNSLEAFRKAADRALNSLKLAAPVAVKTGVWLAVENHKDWRADELVSLLKKLGSDRVGVCLDTGNSIALLEDPNVVVETLAPLTITTHLKDMAVEEYADGFLLAEVPFGTGYLDLPRVAKTIRAARPETRLIIEMITRDPLKIPCLTDRYWTTFPTLPARELARTLASVKKHHPSTALPRISELAYPTRLKTEDDNIRRCIEYAHANLGC